MTMKLSKQKPKYPGDLISRGQAMSKKAKAPMKKGAKKK